MTRALALVVMLAAYDGVRPMAPRAAQVAGQARESAGTATGAIRGRVTDRVGGQPLGGVVVTLGAPPSGPLGGRPIATQTDADGRYAFARLPPGPYSLTFAPPAHRATHLPHAYGERQPLKPRLRRPYPISLRSGEQRDDAHVALWRALAIGGRVTDEAGQPLVGLEVHAFTADGTQVTSADTTRASDDRGVFRLFGLRPGRYLVCAEPRTDWQQFWQPLHAGLQVTGTVEERERPIRTCHVSAANDADAQIVSVSSSDVDDVQISVRRSRTFTVRGTIVTASGAPFSELRPSLSVVRLERRRTSPSHVEMAPGGQFVVRNLVPGDYLLRVDRYGTGEDSMEREMARVPFRVEAADITGLTIVMEKPAKVAGRVVFEEPPAPRQLGPMRVLVRQDASAVRLLAGPSPSAEVKADLSFELAGLHGPQLIAVNGLPRDYFVKAITYRGRDITDTPVDFKSGGDSGTLEILLSRRGSFLTGTVLDEQGRRADDVVVLVFAADPARWHTAGAVALTLLVPPQGPYTAGPVRAGEYLVVALPGDEVDAHASEPETLEVLARIAERVVLIEGERRMLDLRVSAVR